MPNKKKVLHAYKRQAKKAEDWRPAFLKALASRPFAVGWAAESAGVSRKMAYIERDSNLEFAEEWEQIVERAIDEREQTLWDSTAPGAEKHENMTGLIFMLKARRKAIYGGVGDGPVSGPTTVIFKDGRDNA